MGKCAWEKKKSYSQQSPFKCLPFPLNPNEKYFQLEFLIG